MRLHIDFKIGYKNKIAGRFYMTRLRRSIKGFYISQRQSTEFYSNFSKKIQILAQSSLILVLLSI